MLPAMPTTSPFVADVPGRGAWRRVGGLLPLKPDGTGDVGYYREAAKTETPIGSAWVRGTNKGHTSRVVWHGVRAIQQLIGLTGRDVDGWFGPRTADKVLDAQTRLRVKADAVVGPATMRALLLDLIQETSRLRSVPVDVLGGLLVFESGLDPAAVGTNGYDSGVAQINLAVHHASVTLEQALSPVYAVDWAATNVRSAYDRFNGRTTADPWDIAVAWHNSPVAATAWARAGAPQYDSGRSIQIEDYVAKVRDAW
jgi:hypothetical protein